MATAANTTAGCGISFTETTAVPETTASLDRIDEVGLAPSGPGPTNFGLVDPFGFSWFVAVSPRRPRSWPLDCLGFPWGDDAQFDYDHN
jgi:hypothetical protein